MPRKGSLPLPGGGTDCAVLCFSECIVNALEGITDIGRLFIGKRSSEARLWSCLSRISYELIRKALRSGIPIVAAASRPTPGTL